MNIHLYWWRSRQEGFRNFGDEIGKYILEKLFNANIIYVIHPSMRRYKYLITHYLSAGSIISEAKLNSVVWGSGIMFKNQNIENANFLAVRGPFTKKHIEELGYRSPTVLGDPALLLPLCFMPKLEKKYHLGIIPHYVDYEIIYREFIDDKDILVIDLKSNNVEEVISQIVQCKTIISSSLHGLIVPHAYGIRAIWVKFSDNLGGDDIKFLDYLHTVGLENHSFLDLRGINLNKKFIEQSIMNEASRWEPDMQQIEISQNGLLSVAPWSKPLFKRFLFEIQHKVIFIKKLLQFKRTQ